MEFLSGQTLDASIRRIAASPDACCAVAFWGRGASSLFSKGQTARIICNLVAGGTNPYEIEALIKDGHKVRQHDRLHAKVYIGGGEAVIASANLSANGLGLEADEIGHWIEAGVRTADTATVSSWFEELWLQTETRSVTETDIRRATILWKSRRQRRPSLLSFADFDANAEILPLVRWWEPVDVEANEESIKAQIGLNGAEAQAAAENSVEVDHPGDARWLSKGTLILWWRRAAKNDFPSKTASLHWSRCGDLVKKVYRNKGEQDWHDAVLNDRSIEPVPFSCDDKRFTSTFYQVMTRPQFEALRQDDATSGIASRIALTRQFWHEIKIAYLANSKQ
jgi:hypothetical protein